jgi:hypothetical protein
MPRGSSGRVVVEIDPHLKRRLYTALAIANSTLKEWFVDAATRYVAELEQPTLPGIAPQKTSKGRGTERK